MAQLSGETISELGVVDTSGYLFHSVPYPAETAAAFVFDTAPPLISNYVPPLGTIISRSQTIGFDVTDDRGLTAVLIYVAFGSDPFGAAEIVHDSNIFRSPYNVSSTRVTISNGYRYTVTRVGGWQGRPNFVAHAIDREGNENA